MSIQMTQEAANQVYQCLTAQDATFIQLMARAAITSAAETKASMWTEQEEGTQVFDANDVRAFAGDFTSDMLADFKESLLKAIKSAKVDLQLELKVDPKFED